MKKAVLAIGLVLLLNLSFVGAITLQEIGEARNLIGSKISCDKLTTEQLEIIGEYYMEQMHPGEAHEFMHKMMGLQEGSDAEKQFHIDMAKTLYCGESVGMMGSGNMVAGGMMNMMPGGGVAGGQNPQTNAMQGMMGNWGYWNFVNVLYAILLIGLIILVFLWIVKSWKSIEHNGWGKK